MPLWKKIALLFLSWKTILFISISVFSLLVPLNSIEVAPSLGKFIDPSHPYLIWIWANFDGVNYIYIAREGYGNPNFAFFPLLPLLLFIGNKLLALDFTRTGILLTYTAFFTAAYFVYKITRLDYDEKTAFHTLVFLILFPLSFFYGAIYTDALFLLFSTASFYFARKQNWFLAGTLGYFASLTRLPGVILFPVLLLEWYLYQKPRNTSLLKMAKAFFKHHVFFVFLIPLGLLTYSLYLEFFHYDFLLFQKAMSNWGQGQFVFPPQVMYRYVKIFVTASLNVQYFVALLEFVATISYFALTYYVFKKVRVSYAVFMFLLLILVPLTGTFAGMPRYLLHLFPGFIALSLLTRSSSKLFIRTIIFFAILQIALAVLFARGYFVA